MTTEEKNVAIAEMLNWYKTDDGYLLPKSLESGYDYMEWANTFKRDNSITYYALHSPNLKFHSDANWQFEALEFVHKLHPVEIKYGFGVIIDFGIKRNAIVEINKNTKEAIFEALYQFSIYLKEKK